MSNDEIYQEIYDIKRDEPHWTWQEIAEVSDASSVFRSAKHASDTMGRFAKRKGLIWPLPSPDNPGAMRHHQALIDALTGPLVNRGGEYCIPHKDLSTDTLRKMRHKGYICPDYTLSPRGWEARELYQGSDPRKATPEFKPAPVPRSIQVNVTADVSQATEALDTLKTQADETAASIQRVVRPNADDLLAVFKDKESELEHAILECRQQLEDMLSDLSDTKSDIAIVMQAIELQNQASALLANVTVD